MAIPQLPLESMRDAMSAGEFDKAQSLWNECAAALARELQNGWLSEARLFEVRAFVEWSRITVLCARAKMLDQLHTLQAGLQAAQEYELGDSAPAHCMVDSRF